MRAAALALFVVLLAGCPTRSSERSPVQGLTRPDGTALAADARPTVLAFWTDWAPPCSSLLAELPKVGDKARVVAAFCGQYEPGVEARAGSLEFALASDSLTERLGVNALPTVLVLDRAGRTAARFEGYSPLVCAEVAVAVESLAAAAQ